MHHLVKHKEYVINWCNKMVKIAKKISKSTRWESFWEQNSWIGKGTIVIAHECWTLHNESAQRNKKWSIELHSLVFINDRKVKREKKIK